VLLLARGNAPLTTKKMEETKKNKGGRPPKQGDKHDQQISVWLSQKEYDLVESRAIKAGLKIGVYSREMLLQGEVKARLSVEQLNQMKAVSKATTNLNQLSKTLSYFASKSDVSGLKSRMIEIDILINHLRKIQYGDDNKE